MKKTEISTILLAEDDELVREIAKRTLQDAGYRVLAVGDGTEALAALDLVRPDLILSDVRMPRCDGFELLNRVRGDVRNDNIPFIVVSAKADSLDQRQGMSLGADDYVTKPYRPEDLLKTIGVRLAKAKATEETLRLQERFLARVLPHELRTPLTGIIGYADLMEIIGRDGEGLTAEQVVDFGGNIARSGRRLLRVAEDLSLLAWLGSSSIEDATPFRLTTESVRRWAQEAECCEKRSGDLVLEVESATVKVPSVGLNRVVAHLIGNGCKFSRPGDVVEVRGCAGDGVFDLTVSDRGRGMGDEEIRAIGVLRQFGRDRFEQQGIGVGLGLARRFAEAAGGGLHVARNPGGVGLQVRLRLPRVHTELASG